jgi:hypothetical protein
MIEASSFAANPFAFRLLIALTWEGPDGLG